MTARPLLFAPLALAACFQLTTAPSDGGAGPASSGSGSAGDGAAPAAATGGQCFTSTESGATLCATISTCPSLVVDRDVFPNCGFRIQGQTLDLECDCNGALCPIGVPVSCTQAAQLLMQQQSETNVCTQVSEGRCTQGTPTPAPSSTGSCDPACRAECSGNPSCNQLCGC